MDNRTTLRNRKTGEHFIKEGYGLKKLSLYSKHDTTFNEFKEFLDDLKRRLPDTLSENDKREFIKEAQNTLQDYSKEIKQLANHPEIINQLKEKVNQSTAHQSKLSDDSSISAFISILAKSLVSAHFNALFPKLALFTTLFSAAAAQGNFQMHEGSPEGGADLCSGILLGCIQGYFTKGTEPWTTDMPQFNRIVQDTTTKSDGNAYRQLKNCMDLENVGSLVEKNFPLSSNETTTICSAQSTIWRGEQVVSQVTNMPLSACETYKSEFLTASQQCMSSSGALKYGLIATGIALPLFVMTAVAFYCCYKNDCELRRDNCC